MKLQSMALLAGLSLFGNSPKIFWLAGADPTQDLTHTHTHTQKSRGRWAMSTKDAIRELGRSSADPRVYREE